MTYQGLQNGHFTKCQSKLAFWAKPRGQCWELDKERHVYTHTETYMYVYTHVCMHSHTHTHTHTHTQPSGCWDGKRRVHIQKWVKFAAAGVLIPDT